MELIETKDGHDCGVDSGSILHFFGPWTGVKIL